MRVREFNYGMCDYTHLGAVHIRLVLQAEAGGVMGETTRVSGHTKTVALIGTPVSHSLSPAMHNLSFSHLNKDLIYLCYDIPSESSLKDAFYGMKALGFVGCNVTMPYKAAVIPFLDELDPAAELMGAVNTIVFKDGRAIGHNTDGAGFMRAIADKHVDIIGKHLTLIGAGGAGSSIFTQAALDGVASITIFNRRDGYFDKTQEKLTEIAKYTDCTMKLIDLDDQEALRKSVAASTLVVNATRVGMLSMANMSVLNPDFMVDGLAVADTVYEPRKTKLLQDAENHGLITIPGLGMLLHQAAISEEIWIEGTKMPIDLIEKTVF